MCIQSKRLSARTGNLVSLVHAIRDFPDHATFREKGAKLACADKLGVFLSLTLCNKANFDPLQRVQYGGLKKSETGNKCMDCFYFPNINHLMKLVCLIF